MYDNQVLYSFKLRTSPLETWTWFEATDQGRTYRLLMGKGETDHYYLNLPVRARPAIQCSVDHSVEELSFSETEYMTQAQQAINDSLIHEGNAHFRLTVEGTPRKLVVMPSPYRGDRGWETPYGVVPVQKFELGDTAYMAFQDPHFVNGSYMLFTITESTRSLT